LLSEDVFEFLRAPLARQHLISHGRKLGPEVLSTSRKRLSAAAFRP
jgi:hypothetical protein